MFEISIDTGVMSKIKPILEMNAITHPFTEFRIVHESLLCLGQIFEKFLQHLVFNFAFT